MNHVSAIVCVVAAAGLAAGQIVTTEYTGGDAGFHDLTLGGTTVSSMFTGPVVSYEVDCGPAGRIHAERHRPAAEALIPPGTEVFLRLPKAAVARSIARSLRLSSGVKNFCTTMAICWRSSCSSVSNSGSALFSGT